MVISRSIDIDYGHTLSKNNSFCNQFHGHRAKVVCFFEGETSKIENNSSQGMVLDFKICKKAMMICVHDKLDHAFAVWKKDIEPINIIEDVTIQIFSSGKFVSNKDFAVGISTLDFIRARNEIGRASCRERV